MTLSPSSLRHNLIELVSAAENQLLIADTEGELLFTATKGMGLVYKISYLLFDNFLHTDVEQDHLKKALDKTLKSYQDVVKRLIMFSSRIDLFSSHRNLSVSEEFCYFSITIASFHKAVKNPRVLEGINKICMAVLRINFPLNLERQSEIDLLRRFYQFEALTQCIFPINELAQAHHRADGRRLYQALFRNYAKKIFTHPLPLDSQESIEERKKIIQKKLIKLLIQLSPLVKERLKMWKSPQTITEDPLLSIWMDIGCEELTNYLPRDQKWPAVFEFDDYVFHPKESVQWVAGRDWMEVSLNESENLVVILFQNPFKEVFYREGFQTESLIPLNAISAINPKKGYWLQRKFLIRLHPLSNVEKEVVNLINHLKIMRVLPLDFRTKRIEVSNLGFTDSWELKTAVPHFNTVYHLFYIQDFLWRLTGNAANYYRIFKKTHLGAALMGVQVTQSVKAYLKQKDKKVREIAAYTKTVEEDFEKFWVEPFKRFIEIAKHYDKKKVFKIYQDHIAGSYPFDNLIIYVISKTG